MFPSPSGESYFLMAFLHPRILPDVFRANAGENIFS